MTAPQRLLLAAAFGLLATGAARAQPEPSLHAGCGDLRTALAELPPIGPDIVTVAVTGTVAAITTTEALTFMVVCSPPDTQVVCAAYTADGRTVGDRVTVAGAMRPGPRDRRVLLDPCIHFRARTPP